MLIADFDRCIDQTEIFLVSWDCEIYSWLKIMTILKTMFYYYPRLMPLSNKYHIILRLLYDVKAVKSVMQKRRICPKFRHQSCFFCPEGSESRNMDFFFFLDEPSK